MLGCKDKGITKPEIRMRLNFATLLERHCGLVASLALIYAQLYKTSKKTNESSILL